MSARDQLSSCSVDLDSPKNFPLRQKAREACQQLGKSSAQVESIARIDKPRRTPHRSSVAHRPPTPTASLGPATKASAAPSADAPSAISIGSAIALALFVLLFLFRYVRTVVQIYSWNIYKPESTCLSRHHGCGLKNIEDAVRAAQVRLLSSKSWTWNRWS